MTPEERDLVTELFDRLTTLEDAPRDRVAERLVQEGLRQAPNAPYALVQTVLVQDEALKRADARIRELEAQLSDGAEPPRQGGFLDSMRDSLWGRRETPPRAGSVPTVRPAGEPKGTPMGTPMSAPPGYRADAQPTASPYAGGGSFLGTAAATAAGVIGASMLMSSIRSMMGPTGGSAHAAYEPSGGGHAGAPWNGAGGDVNLARDAGLDDIGRSADGHGDAGHSHGFADSDAARDEASTTYDDEDRDNIGEIDDDADFDDDFGGDSGGDE